MTALVLGLLRPYTRWLIVVFLAMLVEIVMALAAPWPLKLILDDALGRHRLPDWLAWAHMIHSWATATDDPTEQPRWGKIGKQRIAGELCPKRMETVDDEILDNALKFVDQARRDNKPFFLWLNPTRMHVATHLSEKYENLRTPENNWSVEEAGMAQLDDIVGSVMKYVKDNGL